MFFYTKVAGVTFENRQRVIAKLERRGLLEEGEGLILKREPFNPYDSNAVAVYASNGEQIGFLPKDIAKEAAPRMDRGVIYRATVVGVTGGDAENVYGVNIKISYDYTQESHSGSTASPFTPYSPSKRPNNSFQRTRRDMDYYDDLDDSSYHKQSYLDDDSGYDRDESYDTDYEQEDFDSDEDESDSHRFDDFDSRSENDSYFQDAYGGDWQLYENNSGDD